MASVRTAVVLADRRAMSLLCVLACAGLLLAPQAWALRCPDGVVDVGDHKIEVVDACGEPRSRERVLDGASRLIDVDGVRVRQATTVGLEIEEWVYEFSPQRFRQLLRFSGSRLIEIRALDKPD